MDEIIRVIGYEAALLLASHYGGCSLYVPLQRNLKQVIRNRLIMSDRSEGMKLNTLARKYDLSVRRIIAICNG